MTAPGHAFRENRTLVRSAKAVVLIHLAVTIAHGLAHGRLGIGLSAPQEIFVWAVIVAGPLVAAYLLRKNEIRNGAALLMVSMGGAFLFGVYFHYVAPGPDNVNYPSPLGLASWTRLFNQTAVGIAGLEVLGTILGLTLVLKPSRAS